MSLRTRLLMSILLLIATALVLSAFAIYYEQRSYLYGRADQSVEAAAAPMTYALGLDARLLTVSPKVRHLTRDVHAVSSQYRKGLVGFVPSGAFGEFVGPTGNVLRGPILTSYDTRTRVRPAIPARVLQAAQSSGTPKLYTVASIPKSKIRFRVAVVPLDSGAGAVAVAIPLRDTDEALDRLVLVEVIVVAAVLIALTGLGWVVIRLALRPLDAMSRVANEISEGDLSRRVTPSTTRTEIGRLGLSLNRMLVRIEDAFAGRARSEERQRQFLLDASHELRTPLASIRGYAELFRLGPARNPELLERAMSRIESEAARMGVLVEDLLALARLDELPKSRRVPVDMGELVVGAVADARAAAPGRPISLTSADAVEVLGDPDGLRQVLNNLLSNAVTHTPPDTPVEVSVSREGPQAVLEVRDHGLGLPVDAEEQVFERFWRAEAGRTRDDGGSGLGLSIVHAIVEAHDGTVQAANRPTGGALFTVRLPAAPPGAPAPDAADRGTSASAETAGRR
ncbi:MAG TPA: HAMP domain-containing sensor histidine kinase [Solirubrobacteraceae bacterium]|nr:HAMP domain-containing sensor histidine kinase [Solirubrobacteraceae bacterium]